MQGQRLLDDERLGPWIRRCLKQHGTDELAVTVVEVRLLRDARDLRLLTSISQAPGELARQGRLLR
jgi:hypothetical protein